ncbi:MAG: hemerythrin domain-containing protein, partial [Sulfuritalea sp.]|nr:hemerythrin domain-containing protein [Sulfuritalea sp.]
MSALTEALRDHHGHCDDLFAAAETAGAAGRWTAAQQALADLCAALESHFLSEEDLLFPAFEAATGMQTGPTRVMRAEHEQMRALLTQMGAALAEREAEPFAGTAETLLILMQQHNMKEENILYPMCERGLAGQAGLLEPLLRERLGR